MSMSARTRTVNFGQLCASCPLRYRQRRPLNADPPARGTAARRPRPGPHPGIKAGLPHPVSRRADHLLDRHPERPPGPAPLHRYRKEQRLAANPVRRDQPAHPAPAQPDPPWRSLDPGLTPPASTRTGTSAQARTPAAAATCR